MPRCPWNGSECDCTGWVHTHPIPPRCEARTPVYMLAMYLNPLRISAEGKAKYLKWMADGMPHEEKDI